MPLAFVAAVGGARLEDVAVAAFQLFQDSGLVDYTGCILETDWFKSSVCRNKHNLFGLTNSRTKTYYEFNHWTESVKAYYTKVQYRYKGGNYLLWLKKIGYAEDKGYIRAIIDVLRQLN